MSPDNNLDESDLFSKIINTFLESEDLEGEKPNVKEIGKHKSIIELMDGLKSSHNKELAKNALILLLNLYDDYPPDLFSTLGKDLEGLSDEDRDEAMDKPKNIFLDEEGE